MERIPISIWSLFPSVTNPFPNRFCAHLGIEVKITIWECFPYGDHRFHMMITVRKWAGRLEYSHMGNPRFRIEFVSIWGLTHIDDNSNRDYELPPNQREMSRLQRRPRPPSTLGELAGSWRRRSGHSRRSRRRRTPSRSWRRRTRRRSVDHESLDQLPVRKNTCT